MGVTAQPDSVDSVFGVEIGSGIEIAGTRFLPFLSSSRPVYV